jgi:microcystin-dependent protein
MSEPFLSELKCVSFNFAPKGWALSNGNLLPINQNQALFSLLGTTYGGDGRTTFGLPNLQGRTAISMGNSHTLGELGGEYAHTLTIAELPTHPHMLQGVHAGQNSFTPTGNLLADTTGALSIYGPFGGTAGAMVPATVSVTGGSQPHPNQSPFLVMTWIIALQGIFPSHN